MESKHVYIKSTREGWFLFDELKKRTGYNNGRYLMVCDPSRGLICGSTSHRSKVQPWDKDAMILKMDEYLKLATFIKAKKRLFNKKSGKLSHKKI